MTKIMEMMYECNIKPHQLADAALRLVNEKSKLFSVEDICGMRFHLKHGTGPISIEEFVELKDSMHSLTSECNSFMEDEPLPVRTIIRKYWKRFGLLGSIYVGLALQSDPRYKKELVDYLRFPTYTEFFARVIEILNILDYPEFSVGLRYRISKEVPFRGEHLYYRDAWKYRKLSLLTLCCKITYNGVRYTVSGKPYTDYESLRNVFSEILNDVLYKPVLPEYMGD